MSPMSPLTYCMIRVRKIEGRKKLLFFFFFFFGLWNFFLNEIIIFHHAFTFISLSNDAKRQAQN